MDDVRRKQVRRALYGVAMFLALVYVVATLFA